MSSVIGAKIRQYRRLRGITQEQLGSLVGVTTQAVSKWERGGTPDAELLPEIADVLEVSVDALFGRAEVTLEAEIISKLVSDESGDVFNHAFRLCCMVLIGLVREKSIAETIPEGFPDNLRNSFNIKYFSKLLYDSGIVCARLSHDFRYFFLLPSPEKPLNEKLVDREQIREVFEVLSHPEVLDIIFYMYTRLNTPVSTSLIAKNTGLSHDRADEWMKMLCNVNLADCSVIATENGEINSYTFRQESSLIPLLCFADEICQRGIIDYLTQFERKTPLFKPMV